jgi:hypothetical protein
VFLLLFRFAVDDALGSGFAGAVISQEKEKGVT